MESWAGWVCETTNQVDMALGKTIANTAPSSRKIVAGF